MTAPASFPSPLLKWMARLARWTLVSVGMAWLLVAIAWGVLHGWIVPRIGEFRPLLERQVAQALGVPVRMGALRAQTVGLIPSFELQGLVLLDPQGRPALQLSKVVVALSPRSLLQGGVEQLYIERPDLDIRRSADGRIHVAGITIDPAAPSQSDGALDWLTAQTEVLVRDGTLRWTDALRPEPPLVLSHLQLRLRNSHWRHHLRIDAAPPSDWGAPFTVTAQFREPLLQAGFSSWRQWLGQVYVHVPDLDWARLQGYADWGGRLRQGRGALRAWLDWQRGAWQGGTVDLALDGMRATLADRPELAFASLAGRLVAKRLLGGWEAQAQDLRFETDDGRQWPGGQLRLQVTDTGKGPEGEFRADRLDLAALARIADRLPLGPEAQGWLERLQPQGLVEDLQARWQGPPHALQGYQVRGQAKDLSLADRPQGSDLPGVRGAAVAFDLNQSTGKARVTVAQGALRFPGVFEDPLIPVDRLQADLRWQREGSRIAVQASELRFANDDLQGEARLAWHAGGAPGTPGSAPFPGVLELSGSLGRTNGARVHRYLPLVVAEDARRYVREAIQSGTATQTQFQIRGPVQDIPFERPQQGEFRIVTKVQDVTYAYVPPYLQPAGEPRWPALTQLGGELVFNRSSFQVRGASGSFAGNPGLRVVQVEAAIPDFSRTVVGVKAQVKGPLGDMLAFTKASPLSGMTSQALDQASAQGGAELQLGLSLPVSDINASKVQGTVQLNGNEVHLTPETPPLARARGAVQFTEAGFTLQGVQARTLGGEVRIEGGMRPASASAAAAEARVQIRAQGLATAEGLQQATMLGPVAALARHASGNTAYALGLAFRRGLPEVQVQTNLQGLALDLPAPLGKRAEALQPLRFDTQVLRPLPGEDQGADPPLRDQLTLDLPGLGSATYQREHWPGEDRARVLRGAVALGLGAGEDAPLPAQGVRANVQLAQLDVDAWEGLLSPLLATAAPAVGTGTAAAPARQDYLPTTVALRVGALTTQARTLNQVVAGGSREQGTWRANFDTREASGYVEYRPPVGGASARLFARLARLHLPPSEVSQVEALLDERSGTLPALDIVVDDFELRGRALGRLEIEAQNRGREGALREWHLSKLNLHAPEATLTGSGRWALPPPVVGAARTDRPGPKHTQLDFRLDIRDAGALLGRFGMAQVLARGKGRIDGDIAWMGPPTSPDYRSMQGQLHLDLAAGQFLKADPGLAKLLGVLSLQSLPRRLALDFRDVFSQGFAFDFVRGDVQVARGVATTNNLQMKGVNAAVLMEGSAQIEQETQDLRVVVVPEINAMTASLVATAINPVVGLGSFLAQVFLRGPVIEAATQELRVHGTWADPQVERVARSRPDASPPAPTPGTSPAEGSRP